jgi:polar amino acid transport system substrate-binding protein
MSMPLSPDVISELAPTGVLRAGINLSNFLLVTKVDSTGEPGGVAADLAGEVAMRLGVSVKYVTFKSPGELADAVDKDIGTSD